MKIAHVVENFPAVTETFILNQIVGLISRGHEASIVSHHRPPFAGDTHAAVWRFRLLEKTEYLDQKSGPGARILRLGKAGLRSLAFRPRETVADAARALVRRDNRLGRLDLLGKLWLLRVLSPEIVHVHFGTLARYWLAAARCLRLPMVVSFYGRDASFNLRRDPHRYDDLFRSPALVLALSQDMERTLVHAGCPEEKIQVHHIGIDLDVFAFYERSPEREGIEVLTVAAAKEKKGLDVSIAAFARALQEYPGMRYRIISDGPSLPELRGQVERLGLESAVTIETRPAGKIVEPMRNADVFMLASVTARDGDKEGTPTVLLEAQATGLPVVSTFHAGIPEVVTDGESGLLATEGDIAGLAQQLLRLARDRALRLRMGLRGKERVEKEFNLKTQTCRLEEVYRRQAAGVAGKVF